MGPEIKCYQWQELAQKDRPKQSLSQTIIIARCARKFHRQITHVNYCIQFNRPKLTHRKQNSVFLHESNYIRCKHVIILICGLYFPKLASSGSLKVKTSILKNFGWMPTCHEGTLSCLDSHLSPQSIFIISTSWEMLCWSITVRRGSLDSIALSIGGDVYPALYSTHRMRTTYCSKQQGREVNLGHWHERQTTRGIAPIGFNPHCGNCNVAHIARIATISLKGCSPPRGS